MRKVCVFCTALFAVLLLGGASRTPTISIQIESPATGTEVAMETVVKGRVSDPKANVFVLVHPLRAKPWWVQRIPAPANRDGSWQTLCYFGDATAGLDEEFQIVAIVSPRKLKERQTLNEVPKDVVRSEVVTVKRTR